MFADSFFPLSLSLLLFQLVKREKKARRTHNEEGETIEQEFHYLIVRIEHDI